ncbi:translation initiation factor IF-2 [Artibeus jamaicensis]|uniref:translation initiation factor IF-2 n=1 Tax=Artibeus jamaicensis TaxID=9417 RepID=UPI00235ACF1F|nr:translation initiation factor IF-2 [Artibeus jamaicensis]
MAVRGPKPDRHGRGRAGVLRCRVVGLQRLHNWASEARKEPQTHGGRYNPSEVQQTGPHRRGGPRPQAWRGSKQRFPSKSQSGTRWVAELQQPESSRQRGQNDPPSSSKRKARENRTRLLAPCVALRRKVAPRRRSPAAVRPGSATPGWLPGHPPPDRPPSPGAGQTSSFLSPRVLGCRRPRPARRASSLPLRNPRPRARSGRRASAPTKPAARRRPGEGPGVAAEVAQARRRHTSTGRVQRGRGGQRKGKKVSPLGANALPSSLVLARSAPPARARPPVLVAVGRDRRGGRGDAVAWRESRSLTSVQSERLDHCQCRHVCRGSRSDARLQQQQPLESSGKTTFIRSQILLKRLVKNKLNCFRPVVHVCKSFHFCSVPAPQAPTSPAVSLLSLSSLSQFGLLLSLFIKFHV